MKKYIIEPEYHGYKVGDYLKEVLGYSSRSMRKIDIFLNGKKVKPNKKVRKLNRLLVKEHNKGTNIEPIQMDLDIVYEDKNLIILNKEPYLIVHPTKKKVDKTLAHGIVHYMKEQTGEITVPRFYNRLDMNTSGIIVVAKNGFAQAFLQNKEKATVKKYYQTIVKGIVKEEEFVIEESIGRVGDSLKRELLSVEDGGQTAKTGVKVLKRMDDQNLTLLEVELFTGRTHQIRVHLSSIGHPILGDELYGGMVDSIKRQLLHAYKLIFTNPDTGKEETVTTTLPDDMDRIIKGEVIG
ncbi:RluA family pseudouridine synthase [Psychrilyobacter atlanticus]|uniref:RluA family pseudouridine synthase n=1 Tax=Psychrilyobacter atlanticus TaxID=271091 RepID=UPI00040C9300|nr:RluA family pseudouridine synthase [Psychrilyobacter atlanticus]